MNDRTFKYFFVADNCDKLLDERQRAFLQLVTGKKPTDSFTKKIAELTENAKKNLQWRKQYMEYERQRNYDIAFGKKQGREEKAIESAVRLLKMNVLSPEQIALAEDLSLEKVFELQSQLKILQES